MTPAFSLALLLSTLAAGREIAGYECKWGLETHLKEHDGRIDAVLPHGTLRYSGSAMHAACLSWESKLWLNQAASTGQVHVRVDGDRVALTDYADHLVPVRDRSITATWTLKTRTLVVKNRGPRSITTAQGSIARLMVLPQEHAPDYVLPSGMFEFVVVHENDSFLLEAWYVAKAPLDLNLDDPADLEKKKISYSRFEKSVDRLVEFEAWSGHQFVRTKERCLPGEDGYSR